MAKRALGADVAVLVVATAVLALGAWQQPPGPVYTVAQVVAGLIRQPRAWAGRTVLVRGMVATLAYDAPGANGNETCAAQCTVSSCTGITSSPTHATGDRR